MKTRLLVTVLCISALAGSAAQAAEEFAEKGRKAQAAELDGGGLSANPAVLAAQLRAVGLRLVCLRRPFVPRFEGAIKSREVVERLAVENGLELIWGDGGSCALLGRRLPDAERRRLAAALAEADPLAWGPAVEEAAASSDPEVFRQLLAAAAAGPDRAAALARAAAAGERLDGLLAFDETRGLGLAHRALADRDPESRHAAAAALERHGGDKAAALLGRAAGTLKLEAVEEADLLGALERCGGSAAVRALVGLLDRRGVAEQAVEALGRLGGREAAEALEKALAREELTEIALEALAANGSENAARVVARALAVEGIGARAVPAAEAIGGPVILEALLARLGPAKADPDFREEIKRLLREKHADDPKAQAAVRKADQEDAEDDEEGDAEPGEAGAVEGGAIPPQPGVARPPEEKF